MKTTRHSTPLLLGAALFGLCIGEVYSVGEWETHIYENNKDF